MLLQRMQVVVQSKGEHVILVMGSSSWTLHYETAFALSWQMRAAARVAKRLAGDLSRYTRVLGTLHDAEKGPDAGQPFTPGKVYPVNRDVLKLARIGVHHEGQLVAVKLGGATAKIPYQAAQVIGQWLRLRAKEAKRRAGDARHWSRIAAPDNVIIGA